MKKRIKTNENEDKYLKIQYFLIDEVGKYLSHMEYHLMSIIMRLTVGSNKTSEFISYSKIKECANISKTSIDSGLKKLVEFNIIHKQLVNKRLYIEFNTNFGTYNLPELKKSFTSRPVEFVEPFFKYETED